MDHIVFFKENHSFKETLDSYRLSYTRSYTTYFPVHFQQIAKIIAKVPDLLLFYFAENLNDTDRIRLRNLEIDHPLIKVCLLSDESHAMDAWRLKVFHFEDYPISAGKISNCYKKYVNFKGGESKEVILKENGETYKISTDDITYLQAAGNYTMIHQKHDKYNLQTKQLGTYEYLTEKDLNIKRVNRSLMVNIKNIQSVGSKEAKFYTCSKALSLSEVLESKLKKEILGK